MFRSVWKLAPLALLIAGAPSLAAAPQYRVLDRYAGPDGFWDYVRVDPARDRVLVTRGDSVTAVDLKTGAATAGLFPGKRLHIAMPVNGGAEILTTNGGADTAVFSDAGSGKTLATVATGKGPDAAAVDPASGLVLVMDHAGGDVTLIDPRRHEKVGVIEIGGELEEAAADGHGRAFVNVENKNEIAALDLKTRKVTARYPLQGCDGPTGIAYDAKDDLLIAACDGATELVQARTGKVVQTLATGHGADGVAYDARRNLAFVPAGRDGTLFVIALSGGRGQVIQTLATQRSARTIALDERTGRLYLPAAEFGPPPAGGGRPSLVSGSFRTLAVGP